MKTLEGGTVTPAMMGGTYTVNGANVVCGNVTDRQRHRLHHQHGPDAPVLLMTLTPACGADATGPGSVPGV